jgi:uncharacterized protein YabN with tetrapyrrole methylase and pyrophosphatase domain
MSKSGSLACVGLGMTLGAHLGPRARSYIENADVVFAAVSDPLVELWVQGMNGDVRSLQDFYADGKCRHSSYQEMVAAIMHEVRSGRRVCGAFYGHPGVFAMVPHMAIATAREEGHAAVMEAAVSAADCLYADLAIDPGSVGCQHYEASQFMFYRRRVDPSAYLVLWQIGVAGDRTFGASTTGAACRELLLELLAPDYPMDHEVIIYEAATLPILEPRSERVALGALATAALKPYSTLVIPPSRGLERNSAVIQRLEEIEKQAVAA